MTHPTLQRIRERRFVEWTLAYVAGSWVALQVLDFLRENFGWSVGLVRVSTILIVTGFAVHLVIIWFHGEQGRQRVRAVEVILVSVILVAGGITATRVSRSASGSGDPTPRSSGRLIAVLPFANATGDPDQDFYAEGITRELIGILADAGVRVLGYRAVEPYAARNPDSGLAELLQVDAIAVGSVRRSGSIIQIGAELLDPASGETLWSDVMSREGSDVIRLQKGIARAIADGLQAKLSPAGRERLRTGPMVEPEAYAQYLLGREQMLRWTEDGFNRSVRHFRDAIALDPAFAPAWASLAVTHCYALFYAWVDPVLAREEISHAASEAIALDPGSGEGLAARGWASLLLDWDFLAAGRQLSEASTLSRSVSTLYPLFLTHRYAGRFAVGDSAGVHELLAQMEGDRHTPRFGQRADLLFHIGLPDSALVMLRRAVDTRDVDALLYLRGHRSLEPWRSEPAFLSILREVGLERE
ncbi:MAG: hypothetical protein P8170_20760 [Gemmatimonadota bacterium]